MSSETLIRVIREVNREEKAFIPLHAPIFKGKEIEYVSNTIRSTFVSSVGGYVEDVETWVSKFTGAKKAVAMVNGTSALHISLLLAGVKQNEEVLTQALTFVATANSILYVKARPIFLDVDLDTLGLSPSSVEAFLEDNAEIRENKVFNKVSGNRIAAILPMHTFGFMANMVEFQRISSKWNIPIVEDAAEAFGSEYGDQPAGTFGLAGAFSFNGNKIITSGGGGMLISQYEEISTRAKHLTTTAKVPHAWEYKHDDVGYNYRMPNLNAALLLAQLEQFDTILDRKKQLFQEYMAAFAENGIRILSPPKSTTRWNYWMMSIQANDFNDRQSILNETNNNGVMTRPIWKLICDLPMYRDCQTDSLETSRYLEDRIINIPSNARS